MRYSLLVLLMAGLFIAIDVKAQTKVPRLSIGIMAMMGYGKMGNGLTGSQNAVDRDMIHTPLGIFMGLSIKRVRIGLNYEFSVVGQSTNPASVENTNISGNATAPGARLDYYDGKNTFGVVYRPSSEFKLDKVTFAGDTATYKKGSGFSVQYMRQIKKRMGFIFDYTTEEYKDSLPMGNVKFNRFALGVVFANFPGR
jgi:hypothetical protein